MLVSVEVIKMNELIPFNRIESKIYLIRCKKAMLSHDLAGLYGVKTFILNQAVRRNIDRFPSDFMFKLTWDEVKDLRSQFVILEEGRGRGNRYHACLRAPEAGALRS